MKKLLIAALMLIPAQAFAVQMRPVRVNVAADYFSVGDFKDAFEKDTADTVDSLGNAGFNASGKTTTKPAFGGRAGVLFPLDNDFYIGPSVGYMGGLEAKQTITATSGSGDLGLVSETKAHFFRLLLEMGKKIPVSDDWGINLGVGLGAAEGHAEINSMATGLVSGPSTSSKTWNGFTWEISPAVYFKRAAAEFNVGIRYAQFPKLNESDDNAKIQWDTIGLFAGITF